MQDFLTRLEQQELIHTCTRGTFANDAMLKRIPALLRDIAEKNEQLQDVNGKPRLSKLHCENLRELANELASDKPIPLLQEGRPDFEAWKEDWKKYGAGRTWQNAPWLFAELYVFRLVLQVSGFYEHGVDPYHCQYDILLHMKRFNINLTKDNDCI